jgi:ribonuclease HII
MADIIKEVALAFSLVEVSVEQIDRLNVLRATLWGMAEAIRHLPLRPQRVRIDGPHAPSLPSYVVETHIKGDARWPEIAAASILAKTARDAHLERLHEAYPLYGWVENKGYPTPQHRQALAKYGPSPCHRRSFLRGR